MKSNREIRAFSRSVVRGKWFWRLMTVFVLLQCVAQFAGQLVQSVNTRRGVLTLWEFAMKKVSAIQGGLDYALPTREAYRQMWAASGLEYFVALLFGAIVLFGVTAVALRALQKEESGWFAAGVGGFGRPLGVTALMFFQNLLVVLWFFVLIIPGFVAIYRYRFAWYLKCEHPDWGALRCLNRSGKMIDGYKGRAFAFDCYYYVQLFSAGIFVVSGLICSQAETSVASLVGSALSAVGVGGVLYVMVSWTAGRAAFYREVKSVRESEGKNDLPGND